MKNLYRLGLDLGTNSIGWALWKLESNKPTEILDAGVRIFSDGREPGRGGVLGDPLAVKRRDARSMRRRRDRFLQRKRNLVNALVREGLWPNDPELRIIYSEWDPYTLRSKALREKLAPEELGRVLLHLCQRRGFKSNRKEMSKDDDKGVNKQRIKALDEELEKRGSETLGEYMNSRKRQGVRFRENSGLYADRKHYINEFRIIREKQIGHFPNVKWNQIENILFFQRPLKTQQKGKCRYYSDQDRAHKALPSTHRFRVLQELYNIRMIGPHGESVSFSREERDCVFDILENQKTLGFNALRKKLGSDCRFNLEDGKRDKLLGNETSYILRKPEYFGTYWDELDDEKQDEIVYRILEAEEDDDLRQYLSNYRLNDDQINKLLNVTFPTGIARYSAILHRECVRIMKKDFCGYSEALNSMGLDHRAPEGSGTEEKLPYYGKALPETCIIRDDSNQNDEEKRFGKIGNPTVHIALNQLRKIVNALIEKYGKPEEIVVELARELKLGRQKISETISEQNKNQKRNEKLNDELTEKFKILYPSRADREKLMYYRELQQENIGAHCPYCGRIISAEELFTGNVEVEHILPFSRTLDDGRSNKTVAHRRCNLFKRERSPYEAFGNSPEGFIWEEIQSRIKSLPKSKQWRFQQNAMERYENEESGFIQRQLTDNAYIARIARRYLTEIIPQNRIWGVTGRQTAVLRRKWDLNSILSKDSRKKNRSDHRHHAVDASVIGLIDRSMVKKIADANRINEGDLDKFTYNVPEFPGGEQGREKLFEVIKNILPSFKPDHGIQGRFFKETAYGKIRKALPLETVKLTEKLIPDIVPAKIRQEAEELFSEIGFRQARKTLQERYPNISVLHNLWTTSKPLSTLEVSDLKVPSYGNNTKGPSDFGLRRKLLEYINAHPGEKTEKILERYAEENGIRHVRYIPKNQEIVPIKSSPGKGYELDDFAYVDIWMLPQEEGKKPKYEGVFVSRLEANQIDQGKKEDRRPHPAAKKLMRLFKQDTIGIQEGGDWKWYRIAGIQSKSKRIDIQPIWKADQDWFDNLNHLSLHTTYPNTALQNPKTINTLWQKFIIKKIYVHYDGSFR